MIKQRKHSYFSGIFDNTFHLRSASAVVTYLPFWSTRSPKSALAGVRPAPRNCYDKNLRSFKPPEKKRLLVGFSDLDQKISKFN